VVAEGSLFDVTARLDLFTGAHPIPGAVLEAAIMRHDTQHGLTELAFGGEILIVPAVPRSVGDKVRVRIDADDVMLALERPNAVSANNVLAGKVAAIRADGNNADVQLALGEARLIARITSRSLERLALQPGTRVFALIKSVTVGGREQP
jgi:molybdate transport system ATP-binding protein